MTTRTQSKEKFPHEAFLVEWEEIEVGWGDRPDGISLHLTEKDAKAYVKKHIDDLPAARPAEYSYPMGRFGDGAAIHQVHVTDDLYDEIKKTMKGHARRGLRIWHHEMSKYRSKMKGLEKMAWQPMK